jgi:hypothetical protein
MAVYAPCRSPDRDDLEGNYRPTLTPIKAGFHFSFVVTWATHGKY